MSLTHHASGQLFGYTTLPEENGYWGILLPRPTDQTEKSAPDAQDVVQEITADHLVFDVGHSVSDRGFLLTLFAPMALIVAGFMVWIQFPEPHPEAPQHIQLIIGAMLGALAAAFGFTAYRSARKPLPPNVYISRPLRKDLAWQEKSKTWLALDYDTLWPATYARKMFTTSGSSTLYALTLHQLKPGTRKIEHTVTPAPLRGTPDQCRAIWEFIRCYMDGKPEDLPPIRLVPSIQNPQSWMARADRTVFGGLIDDDHRIKFKDIVFAYFVVYFWGTVNYWGERAACWIERTAPRTPLPDWLPPSTSAEQTASLYRDIQPTPTQLQAQEGTLPHMRRRWLICGVLSTALWGFMFGSLVVRLWLLGH